MILFLTLAFLNVKSFAQAPHAVNQNARKINQAIPASQTQVRVAATPAEVHSESPVESLLSEDLIRSLRDPFQLPSIMMTRKESPKTDLEVYPLKEFRLNGVISGKKTRAMLTTPNNKVYFVKVGEKIGVRDGKVTQISDDAIRITEFYTDEHGKRVPDVYELKMSGELISLSQKEE
jgi:Tfp pilus assembly protein PilP